MDFWENGHKITLKMDLTFIIAQTHLIYLVLVHYSAVPPTNSVKTSQNHYY